MTSNWKSPEPGREVCELVEYRPLKIAALTVKGPLIVKMGTVGGDQGPPLHPYLTSSLSDASRLCLDYQNEMKEAGMTADIWAGGEVLRDDGSNECVAVVGPEGRVFLPGKMGEDGRRQPDLEQEYDLTWDH